MDIQWTHENAHLNALVAKHLGLFHLLNDHHLAVRGAEDLAFCSNGNPLGNAEKLRNQHDIHNCEKRRQLNKPTRRLKPQRNPHQGSPAGHRQRNQSVSFSVQRHRSGVLRCENAPKKHIDRRGVKKSVKPVHDASMARQQVARVFHVSSTLPSTLCQIAGRGQRPHQATHPHPLHTHHRPSHAGRGHRPANGAFPGFSRRHRWPKLAFAKRLAHQVGVAANGTVRFNRYLDGSFKLAISSLLQDELRDLQGEVTGYRSVLSSGFSFRHAPMFWFIRTGIDLHYLDSFAVLTDPDCKFFGVDSARCASGSATESKASFLAGLALLLGGAVDLSEDIYVSLNSGVSLYKNVSGDTAEFNYLLSNEIGLGYRFH